MSSGCVTEGLDARTTEFPYSDQGGGEGCNYFYTTMVSE